ncbi:SRPBCC domain-containing protein [Aquimarina sp. 2201CG14-23]|uniref:SRPBCC domain-containing protein n=1 Tax=Aquimarina mycalae TaxID=3040073 RepID=UPI0024781441|nr:SRPBCC domain-containing protein [Aquimarina sp. 2201CG14-23]MDH7448180.1 SRPBCC domain-containing protein [Aquimarina sp. 2201CG14-23]
MKKVVFIIIMIFPGLLIFSQDATVQTEKRIISTVDSTNKKELMLIQEFIVKVPLDAVWNAYTTKKGWESWAVAIAEVNFKINGTIRTNYNKNGKIGDSTTINLHVVNYIPKKLITLQAELTGNFPGFIKKDQKDLYNIIYFDPLTDKTTKITSYGIGYKNNPKYRSLMKFFISGNEMSYQQLIAYLEKGEITKY